MAAAGGKADQPTPPTIQLKNVTFDPLEKSAAALQNPSAGSTGSGKSVYIVQFTGPVLEQWKDAVMADGANLYGYIPDYAFLARMDANTATRVQALDFVRWVGPYLPEYRLSADLQNPTTGSGQMVKVTVETLPDADLGQVSGQIQALGGNVIDQSQNAIAGYIVASVPSSQQTKLAQLDDVVYVEPKLEMKLTNDVGGTGIMGAAAVRQDMGLYGAGQIVAVTDTGLDTGVVSTLHPDFSGRLIAGTPLGRANSWSDLAGHGTHVAGSVLGSGVSSGSNPSTHTYTNSYAGVAPEAKLVFQSVANASGSLTGIPDDLYGLFQQSYALGARVHTNSWGSSASGAYTANSQQTDNAAWDMKDLVILFSAGNDGVDANANGVIDLDSMGSPGTAKNAITVGASENLRPQFNLTWGMLSPGDFGVSPIFGDRVADNKNGLAAFSSRGPTDDGRIKPDVVAPGTFIVSTRSSLASELPFGSLSYWGLTSSGSTVDKRYMPDFGTSMSTPLTAGAAALVREWFQKVANLADPSSALIKAMLLNGAANITPGQYGTGATREIPATVPNPDSGWGRVDLANSLLIPANQNLTFDDNTSGISTGQVVSYVVSGHSDGKASVSAHPGVVTQSAETDLSAQHAQNDFSPADTTAQLVTNPDFEDDSGWILTSDASYSTAYAYQGSHSMKLTSTTTNQAVGFYQLVNIPADATSATLSYAWMNNPAQFPLYGYLNVCISSATLQDLGCEYFPTSTPDAAWYQRSYTFTQTLLDNTRGQQVAIKFYLKAPMGPQNTYYLDNVELNVVRSTATPTPQPSATPTTQPTLDPTTQPTLDPTTQPTANPTTQPTAAPTRQPTLQPTVTPTPTMGGTLKAILVWTDYPGALSAAKALVNDLDLEIIAPDGATHYYGNSGVYTAGNKCLRSGLWDQCNNVEGITIPNMQSGNYQIKVYGHNVPKGGSQPYALVVTIDGAQVPQNNSVFIPAVLK
jgi:hypothetical protein